MAGVLPATVGTAAAQDVDPVTAASVATATAVSVGSGPATATANATSTAQSGDTEVGDAQVPDVEILTAIIAPLTNNLNVVASYSCPVGTSPTSRIDAAVYGAPVGTGPFGVGTTLSPLRCDGVSHTAVLDVPAARGIWTPNTNVLVSVTLYDPNNTQAPIAHDDRNLVLR
ncbi:hypothetical protein AB0D66_33935 [Streptomyces sp. NPDC048270]|uniref:hypothetical protein n=1 Tax=Streptomyces sp. NPDC048270 TaxID=3154615 RepID=UPI003410468D